jgi:hypothetical protein
MPRAGWCRECDEWVWVDEHGGCQHGHGAECVDGIHEQADPTSAERPFGVGEMPLALNRFNWGAFFLPFFWGFAYRSYQVVGAWAVAIGAPLVMSLVVPTGENAPVANIIGVTVAAELVSGLARLWAGANANRLLWARETLRLQVVMGSAPAYTTAHFESRQRAWTLWGAIIIAVGAFVTVPINAYLWRGSGLTYVGAVVPVVWLLAEVGLGLWLDSRMRAEPSEGEPAAPRGAA